MKQPVWMTSQADRRSASALDVQSRGRELHELELQFANVLESIFAEGCHDFTQIAARLTELEVQAPNSGSVKWDLESLGKELRNINSQLDAAFEKNGYGA